MYFYFYCQLLRPKVRALPPCLIATLRLFRPHCWPERQYLRLYSGVTRCEYRLEYPIPCLRWFVTFRSPFSRMLGCTKLAPNLLKKFPSYLSIQSCVATVATYQNLLLYSEGPVFRNWIKVGNQKFVLVYESFQVNCEGTFRKRAPSCPSHITGNSLFTIISYLDTI
jgi:hypothetical protein